MPQRVLSSLALVRSPDVVIADEPTSGLDAALVDRTAEHLLRLVGSGAAVLVITHDLELAQRLGGVTSVLASYLVEQWPRACLARALITAPDYLIRDELTSMLNVSTQAALLEVIAERVRQAGTGVLLITHDRVLAEHGCERIVELPAPAPH